MTWPVRTDTAKMADDLGWTALKHFPESTEIQQIWSRWINSGSFDGTPGSPQYLAVHLARAHSEGLRGWEPANEALRHHVRKFLRSNVKRNVVTAMDHIQAVARAEAPVLATLLWEARGVSGTAEWDDWRESDPVEAEFMKWYVHCFSEEAAGEKNWLRAWENIDRMVAFDEKRRQILAKDQGEQGQE